MWRRPAPSPCTRCNPDPDLSLSRSRHWCDPGPIMAPSHIPRGGHHGQGAQQHLVEGAAHARRDRPVHDRDPRVAERSGGQWRELRRAGERDPPGRGRQDRDRPGCGGGRAGCQAGPHRGRAGHCGGRRSRRREPHPRWRVHPGHPLVPRCDDREGQRLGRPEARRPGGHGHDSVAEVRPPGRRHRPGQPEPHPGRGRWPGGDRRPDHSCDPGRVHTGVGRPADLPAAGGAGHLAGPQATAGHSPVRLDAPGRRGLPRTGRPRAERRRPVPGRLHAPGCGDQRCPGGLQPAAVDPVHRHRRGGGAARCLGRRPAAPGGRRRSGTHRHRVRDPSPRGHRMGCRPSPARDRRWAF